MKLNSIIQSEEMQELIKNNQATSMVKFLDNIVVYDKNVFLKVVDEYKLMNKNKLCEYYPDEDNDNDIVCLIPKEMKNWDKNKCYHPEECQYLRYYKETKQIIIMYVK